MKKVLGAKSLEQRAWSDEQRAWSVLSARVEAAIAGMQPHCQCFARMNLLRARVGSVIAGAEKGSSSLPDEILALPGMSSAKVRHFLSNLVLDSDHYLEVGVWKGSTFISALYGKPAAQAMAVDNWSEFGAPSVQFRVNVEKWLGGYGIHVRDQNAFDLKLPLPIDPVTIYLYDGGHDVVSHTRAFTHFAPSLADPCICIVDDWNMPAAQEGTRAGLAEAGLTVACEWALPAAYNGDHAQWWNGLWVGIVQKAFRPNQPE